MRGFLGVIVLGIDPGSHIAGYGVLEGNRDSLRVIDYGTISQLKGSSFSERLGSLGSGIAKVLDSHRPQIVVIEQLFLGKNVNSAFRLGHARGVCLYESIRAGAEIVEYAPRSVKKGISGNGNADKDQVRQSLRVLLSLRQDPPLDASDALALACYHLFVLEGQRKIGQQLKGVSL